MKFHLLLLFSVLLKAYARVEMPDHFFPVPTTLNNETSQPIYLNVNFTLFGRTTNYVVVSENGLISFPKGKTESFPKRAGRVKDGAYLSLFWTDNFPQFGNGEIYYGEYNNQEMLTRAKEKINTLFLCEDEFVPESVFVATWHNVRMRFECVREFSIEFCDCLASDGHWGDVDFCECRKEHSKEYCERCLDNLSEDESFCNCLDETDNFEYCQCVKNNAGDCSCLRDHDNAYCDCLASSNSPEHAWNCSCLQKYSPEYCECLLTSDENHDYCACIHIGSNCGCYLTRTKSFCDCFRLDKKGNEGYCDCIEQGKDFTLCTCLHELYPTFYYDSFMVQTYCECVASRYGIEKFRHKLLSSYCSCAAQQDPSTCEEDGEDKKRAVLPTSLEYAQQNGLVRPEGNSYQVVIISGGGRSFVIYNYGYFSSDMEQASINRQRLQFYSAFMSAEHPPFPVTNKYYMLGTGFSLSTGSPWHLLKFSNSGVPGQYIFRTDLFPLEEPDCTTRGYTTTVGSMF